MRLSLDANGVSKVIFALLLLLFFIIGSVFSYVYTMGFYAPSEFRLPDKPVLTIESVEFDNQDTSFFKVTLLNPSYSQSSLNITRIETRTPDDNRIHVITITEPIIPYILNRGERQTFQARWNWANYTGIKLPYSDQPVEIRVFLQDRRGEIAEIKRPSMSLAITDLAFNSSISVNHFNVTVRNPESSETYVNMSAISVGEVILPPSSVTPSLPLALNPGDTPAQFQCLFDWTSIQGENVTVRITTFQGYIAESTRTLPEPVTLYISQIVFNATVSTGHFNITVFNAANSSTYVDINRITVAVDGGTAVNISQWAPYLSRLEKNASILIMCTWDWSSYAGKSSTAEITVYTSQGFITREEASIP